MRKFPISSSLESRVIERDQLFFRALSNIDLTLSQFVTKDKLFFQIVHSPQKSLVRLGLYGVKCP